MFGDRLKLARKKAGFSLRSLSEALGGRVSAQAIGKYERGEMTPSSGTLLALAKTLDVSLDYLMGAQVQKLDGVEFRKKAGTSAKDRSRVEADVIEHVERYLTIEEILELDSAEWQQPFPEVLLEREEAGEKLAARVRQAWHLGEDPIPNMTELLEERGIKIFITRLPDGMSGMTCLVRRSGGGDPIPVIVVNQHHTLERRRLTLAHELAHRLIDEESPVDHEKAANYFAGAFLIPRKHLEREIGEHRQGLSYCELIQLKRMYRVSAAAFLVRLKNVGIINESTLAYAFQTFARGWRREEPEPLEVSNQVGSYARRTITKPLDDVDISCVHDMREPSQRFERLCYWAFAEKLISPSKASELLGRPLKQIEMQMKGPAGEHAYHCQ